MRHEQDRVTMTTESSKKTVQ